MDTSVDQQDDQYIYTPPQKQAKAEDDEYTYTPPAQTKTDSSQPGMLSSALDTGKRFLSGMFNEVREPIEAGLHGITDQPSGTGEKVADTLGLLPQYRLGKTALNSVVSSVKAPVNAIKSGLTDAIQGKYPEAAADVMGVVPGMAPVAERARSVVSGIRPSGDLATPLGRTASDLLMMKVGESEAPQSVTGETSPLAQRMYQSALKPSTALSTERVGSIVRTGLNEKIPVSASGVEKLGSLMDDLQKKISDEIAKKPEATIDPNRVAERIPELKGRFSDQVNATDDLNAIERSKSLFLGEQGAKAGKPAIPPKPTGLLDQFGKDILDKGTPEEPPTPAQPMAATKAQSMKQGTYQQIKKSYGTLSNATIESQKALARGLKEEIAQQFPEISQLNAREGKLIDLDGALERAVRRINNHQMIGIGTPIAAGAAGALTKSSALGAATGILKAVFDDPLMKSKLAIAINTASKGKIPIPAAATRIAAYRAALGNASNAQPPDHRGNE